VASRWIPQNNINQSRQQSRDYWNAPISGGKFSGIEGALSGLGYGLFAGDANSAENRNRDYRSTTMAQALEAPDTPSMARILMGSGVPGMDKQGMGLVVQDRQTKDNRKWQTSRDEAAFARQKKLAEFNNAAALQRQKELAEFNNAAALQRQRDLVPLEVDKARQVAELKFELQKKQQQQLLESLGLVPPQQPTGPAAVAAPPAPPDPSDPTPDPIVGAPMPEAPTPEAAPTSAPAQTLTLQQQRARQLIAGGDFKSGVAALTADPNKKANEAYDTEAGKSLAKAETEIRDRAIAARSTLSTLDMLQTLVTGGELAQGPGTRAGLALRRVGGALGIQSDTLSNAQLFEAITSKLALANRVDMPGAMSDPDREFLVRMVPNLSNTQEGNLMLIEYQRRVARRNVEVAQLAERYKANNGGRLDSRFYVALQQWSNQNPLFSQQDRIQAGSRKPGSMPSGWGVEVESLPPGTR
jgi:hypothetical protein